MMQPNTRAPLTYEQTVADVLRRVRLHEDWMLSGRTHIRRWIGTEPGLEECPITTGTGKRDLAAFEITAVDEPFAHYDYLAVRDIARAADVRSSLLEPHLARIRGSLLAATKLREERA